MGVISSFFSCIYLIFSEKLYFSLLFPKILLEKDSDARFRKNLSSVSNWSFAWPGQEICSHIWSETNSPPPKKTFGGLGIKNRPVHKTPKLRSHLVCESARVRDRTREPQGSSLQVLENVHRVDSYEYVHTGVWILCIRLTGGWGIQSHSGHHHLCTDADFERHIIEKNRYAGGGGVQTHANHVPQRAGADEGETGSGHRGGFVGGAHLLAAGEISGIYFLKRSFLHRACCLTMSILKHVVALIYKSTSHSM